MLFFKLLFSYVPLAISFYVPLTNLFSIILFLSADYLRHSRRRRSQILILLIQDKSKNHFAT